MGSGGGGGSSDPSALMKTAAPMGGLPIAGQDSTVGSNPYEYGQFQSFLPDIKAEGQNPMATGLRPDMFQFKSPYGGSDPGGGGGNADAMRNMLAALTSAGAGAGAGGAGAGGGAGGMPGAGGGAGGDMLGPGGGGGVAFPLPQTGATGVGPGFIGGPGGVNMGQMHPAHNQPGVAGQTAFVPWAGTNIRAGGAGGEQAIDWRTRDAGPLIDQPKIGF